MHDRRHDRNAPESRVPDGIPPEPHPRRHDLDGSEDGRRDDAEE